MIVISSHNGTKATAKAFELLQQGSTPLDAVVEGVSEIEDDPADLTVGYGGLPNEDGIVELDAAVMDGPTHRGGAVAGLRDIRHATRVARLVMRQTSRCLLVGQGAYEFASANGFRQENLLTERARRMWLYWKRRRSQHDDWQTIGEDDELDLEKWYEKHFYAPHGPEKNGTIYCGALDDHGDLACATSTSGHAFKIPGRVGDSPVFGAGLFVDNEVGTCGSIGHGEANLENLSSFLGVELMRQGLAPLDAGLEALGRVARHAQPHQCDDAGRPRFNVQLFLLNKQGQTAGVALWPHKELAISDADGTRREACTALFE